MLTPRKRSVNVSVWQTVSCTRDWIRGSPTEEQPGPWVLDHDDFLGFSDLSVINRPDIVKADLSMSHCGCDPS